MFGHEKKGEKNRPKSQMVSFRNAIMENNLNDLDFTGEEFTCSNKHNDDSFTKERLDRTFANSDWKSLFHIG